MPAPLPLAGAPRGAPASGGTAGFALWNLGFRPFYLLAGAFAALAIAVWTAHLAGWSGASSYLADPLWHAHEMIFGFALAVIVGFLFTAVRAWTGQPTPTGRRLMAICGLWLAARVLLACALPLAAALADTLFVLAAVAGIAAPLRAGGNRRNAFLVVVLLAIGAANLAFHLGVAGVLDFPVRRALQAGLDLMLFIMVVIGGRVIPMFSANATPARPVRLAWLERGALAGVALLLIATAAGLPAPLLGALAALAAAAHAARLALWQPWRTLRNPLVWILHAAYAWIVIHLVLRALAGFDLVAAGLATHALTVGAIGGLTLGMMTRTSLGHTGRPLAAGAAETACFVLIQAAALVRVVLPLVFPAQTLAAVLVSGVLWVVAFGCFALGYWGILTRPRVDGQPG